ncbi:hypothetical protein EDB87DRAFT_444252 [Lactarius vividus]|nr:hypothetical protein EDB87DRAFT_444252 [Lactarius vividus]
MLVLASVMAQSLRSPWKIEVPQRGSLRSAVDGCSTRIASRAGESCTASGPTRGAQWEIAYKSAFSVTQSRSTNAWVSAATAATILPPYRFELNAPISTHVLKRRSYLGPPPGQGYYPQQPQQAYQGYSGQPGFQQQAQPQAVYVQQPPPQKDSGFCAACLTGVCLCCCAEGAWCFGYVLRLLWAYEIAQTPRQSFASAYSERARCLPPYLCFTIIDAALNFPSSTMTFK